MPKLKNGKSKRRFLNIRLLFYFYCRPTKSQKINHAYLKTKKVCPFRHTLIYKFNDFIVKLSVAEASAASATETAAAIAAAKVSASATETAAAIAAAKVSASAAETAGTAFSGLAFVNTHCTSAHIGAVQRFDCICSLFCVVHCYERDSTESACLTICEHLYRCNFAVLCECRI